MAARNLHAYKRIPSTQMARELGATEKTAWVLAQRIRETWMGGKNDKMDGQVQVDETYIGGKEKNKHADKKLKGGRGWYARRKRPSPRQAR